MLNTQVLYRAPNDPGTPGDPQGLVLPLHSGITPARLQGPYGMPVIDPGFLVYKASNLPTVLPSLALML